MKYVVFLFLMTAYFLNVDAQLVQELQVTYGDGSRDTFSFVQGNRGNVPAFRLENVDLSLVVDINGLNTVCDSVPSDLSGSIALVDRGVCGLTEKYDNIAEKGAIGFIACNTVNASVPQLGNFSNPALPTGAMSSSDCNLLRFKLDPSSTVNWISEYLLDCSDSVEIVTSNCADAEDLGEILDCPSFAFNSTTLTTYNSCPDNLPTSTCFANDYGAKWITFTTGAEMTSLKVFLIASTSAQAFLEIYDTNGCGNSPSLVTCLSGDSTHLVENLLPETIYHALVGMQAKAAVGEVFIQITNAECKYRMSGVVYHDLNNNGERDEDEELLSDIRFNHKTSERFFISDEMGNYSTIFSPIVDTICLADIELCWAFQDSSDMILFASDGEEQIEDIGLISTGNSESGLSLTINASRPRCNELATVIVQVENRGCTTRNGKVDISIDSILTFVDTTGLSGVTDSSFCFAFEDLLASGVATITFEVEIPDESFDSREIEITATTGKITKIYTDFIGCAIDPNDKLVAPSRDFPNNYTLREESIHYRIRFQNTGTDTAYTVIVQDSLSPLLDWSTLVINGSSHTSVFSEDNGVVTFAYENINLVDSTTNEPLSHGFIEFTIMPKEGVEDFKIIENTASIFFDANQPILTNTTVSTIVSALDNDNDGFFFWEECDDNNRNANPSLVEIPNNDVDENCDGIIEIYGANDCNVVYDDFSSYNDGFFVGQENADWSLQASGSNAMIFSWGDFNVLDIRSDFNQSATEFSAQVVQKLRLVEVENIEIAFDYYNECGILSLAFYEDSLFSTFADLVITSYDFENFENAYYIQQDTFENCHNLFNEFVHYELQLLFDEDILKLTCSNGDTVTVPFYGDAKDFYGIGWGSNQCAFIKDICITAYDAQMIDEDVDGFGIEVDCNDTDPSINPGAEEIPNNDIDENCDGIVLVIDVDIDGFNSSVDCDDNNPLINPDAVEIPNNDIDEDCDGVANVIDEDMDGFNSDVDCNDLDSLIFPGATEIPNNEIDENCDGEDLMSAVTDVQEIEIDIYPNPTKETINVELGSIAASYKVFSAHGHLVMESQNLLSNHEINFTENASGIYLLIIESEDGQSHMRKIIKL